MGRREMRRGRPSLAMPEIRISITRRGDLDINSRTSLGQQGPKPTKTSRRESQLSLGFSWSALVGVRN